MNRHAPTSPRARAQDRGDDHAALAKLVAADERVLGASAITAGLGRVRPRSAPGRLAFEASRFVRHLSAALGRRGPNLAAVREAVRTGSLAAASRREISPVFAVWRRVLRAYLPTVGCAGQEPAVLTVLRELETAALAAARDWEHRRFDLLVVGASAGGLEALDRILGAFDATAPITLAVVQHIGPEDRGLLPTVLARHSRLAIAAAVDGAKLFLGHAYIAPPGRHLVVTADALHLVDGPPVHFVKPAADVLFESAAEAFGSRAASIVLSGTGRDGAAGTSAIRDHGGTTFCQDPETAEFRGMPEAALATGRVDRRLPVGALCEALASAVCTGRSADHQAEST